MTAATASSTDRQTRPARSSLQRFGTLLYALKRARNDKEKYRKIFIERLTEPLHLNLIACGVLLFGKLRHRIAFDLVVRQQFAFPILYAAEQAAARNIRRISIVEFGVASGSGLLNMCTIAADVMRATGVEIEVYGFDSTTGMPTPIDHRDHPEHWQEGDFPMDVDRLQQALPPFAHLLIGDVESTIPAFLATLSPEAPLAFVSLDLDYYSSTKKALEAFKGPPGLYMPSVVVYLDDIVEDSTNPWCGENLAIREFNEETELRKIAPFPLLRTKRIFKNARWIDQIYLLQVLDHEERRPKIRRQGHTLPNEYIALRPRAGQVIDAD
ncbi:MAG: hypothetical protein P4L71_16690 [Acetobacteraceae bacterium]|nr:hypothetical protein [Acetobacteraceae bacterium]